jgi:hypothetical protein
MHKLLKNGSRNIYKIKKHWHFHSNRLKYS